VTIGVGNEQTTRGGGRRTAFEKIWAPHVVEELADGTALLQIDRHILHELSSPIAFRSLRTAGRKVRHPELSLAVQDHILSTDPGRSDDTYPPGADFIRALRRNASEYGIALLDVGDPRQGIVHVVAPELGLALPGCTIVCGDSHTCTLGGIGAVAFGIGTSEVEHVLATQVIRVRKPKSMSVKFVGTLGRSVYAKDLILHLIGRAGANAGTGYAIEFAGPVVESLPIAARLTLCNMSIEMGARIGFVAPDASTFEYLRGRPFAPSGGAWAAALEHWSHLKSDREAVFDREIMVDAGDVAPQVTWGTSPEHVIGIDRTIPDPRALANPLAREHAERALAYMGLSPGMSLEGVPVRAVFIGSCTNSRIDDLRVAADVVQGRKVAVGIRAMVVPGSSAVKRIAEAEGLDATFIAAGFEWRESACSMCGAVNADRIEDGARCVSTSNRNFEGRQGPRVRTHLASPAMAAAAAVAGCLVDVRQVGGLGAAV
jgi:3-isopropylmalate/(R)-2-methylmalate dehydratase large subunit